MIDIPTEIWIYILSFLPNRTLRELYSVNRVFFDASMDARWREVVLETQNAVESRRIFKRLSDPFIGGRVKAIILRYGKAPPPESPTRPTEPHAFRLVDALKTLKSALSRRTPPPNPIREFIQEVMMVTPNLVNISSLNINSSERPLTYDIHIRDLYQAFWTSFGANLRCLILRGHVESFHAMIESSPILPALTELQLDCTDIIFRSQEDSDNPLPTGRVVVEMLTSFVNSLGPHLEGLRICSSAMDLDMSLFFSGLTIFPKLQYFGVLLFSENTLRDTSGLKNVLWNHSPTLQRVELLLDSYRVQLYNEQETPLDHFLLQCLANESCFSQVRILDIYPAPSSPSMEIVLITIKRVSNTIIRLTIRDRYLGDEEALSVIDAASECVHLKYFRINVHRFDIGIMDHLAARLPNLEALWISGGNFIQPKGFVPLGSELTEALKTRSYEKWRLKDFSILQGRAKVIMDDMRLLAASIPSLEGFYEGKYTCNNSVGSDGEILRSSED